MNTQKPPVSTASTVVAGIICITAVLLGYLHAPLEWWFIAIIGEFYVLAWVENTTEAPTTYVQCDYSHLKKAPDWRR